MARKRSKYNRKRTRGRFSFLYKLLTFVVICGAISVALTLFFKIETMSVSGSVRYRQEEIIEASGIQPGDNMFLMNKFNAAGKITADLPYIESVQIRRQVPSTLQIQVTECTSPIAIKQDNSIWLISGTGKIVDQLGISAWENYPQLTGVRLVDPAIGQPAAVAAEAENAQAQFFTLLQQLEQKEMLADIQAIHMEDTSVIILRYLNRFDVVFSYGADFDYKLDYLRAVIERLEINETGSIDMTQNDKASFIPN